MAKRQGRKDRNLLGCLTLAGFLAIVGLVGSVIYIEGAELKAREQAYIDREASLEKQIAEQEARRKTLEERKKYVTTDQYIKEIAKDRLGLLSPDEVLLKENDN